MSSWFIFVLATSIGVKKQVFTMIELQDAKPDFEKQSRRDAETARLLQETARRLKTDAKLE